MGGQLAQGTGSAAEETRVNMKDLSRIRRFLISCLAALILFGLFAYVQHKNSDLLFVLFFVLGCVVIYWRMKPKERKSYASYLGKTFRSKWFWIAKALLFIFIVIQVAYVAATYNPAEHQLEKNNEK